MECPRDLAKDPALVLMMGIPEEAMDLATDPVREAAVTRRDTRGLVLEMDPVLVPRVIRAAVDTEIAMEMEAVLRDIRALVPEMDLAKDLALNPVRMMDTLEVEMVLETEEEMDLVPRDIRAVALEMEAVPRDQVKDLAPNLMMDTLEVVTEEMVETVVAVMMLHPLIP